MDATKGLKAKSTLDCHSVRVGEEEVKEGSSIPVTLFCSTLFDTIKQQGSRSRKKKETVNDMRFISSYRCNLFLHMRVLRCT
jgi:hypothetical protein